MQVHGSATSPFVRKVRVFAIERGVPVDFVHEDPWKKSDALRGLSPLGKVPVLVAGDGRIVIDSLAIIEFLDAAGAVESRLLPADGPARWDALKRHALAHGVIDAAVNRLLETRRPAERQMPERMIREEERIAAVLRFVEDELVNAPGDRPAVAFGDLMLGVAMHYVDFRHPHDWRSLHPKLATLVERLGARASFVETRPPTP